MISAYQPLLRYVQEVFGPVKARKSKAHLQQTLLAVSRFEEYSQGRVTIETLSQEHIDGFKAWRSQPGPHYVAAPTLNKELRYLRMLTNFARKRGHLVHQLFFEFEVEDLDPPLAWWPDELRAIFGACREERGKIGRGLDTPKTIFFQALGATIYSTGVRIGALMKTPRANFDDEHELLTVYARTNKQRRGQVCPLHKETAAALRELLQYDSDQPMLFAWPYDQHQEGWPTLTRHWKRILKRAGLPVDRKHLFHCLRKTTGTYIWAAGGKGAAREQLDHSSESVTERYGDLRMIPRTTAKQLIPPPPLRIDRQMRLFE